MLERLGLMAAFLQVTNTSAILAFPQRLSLSLHLSIPQPYMSRSYPAAFHHKTCLNANPINPQLLVMAVQESNIHLVNPYHQNLYPILQG